MNRKIIYLDPATGLLTKTTANIPDPRVELRYSGPGRGLALTEEAFLITEDTSRPFAQMVHGFERNRMDGGLFVPHGMLQGKETYLSTAVTGAVSTEFTPLAHRTADNELIFVTDAYYLVMDRRPKPEEMIDPINVSALNAEIVQLGTYVADTDPVDLNGATTFANNHPKWAVIQPIVGIPASYDLETAEFGYKYRLEQPAVVTGVTGVDGGSQKIDVSFTQSAQERKGVNGYMISILKKGDDIAGTGLKYGLPISVPEWVFETEYDDGGQQMAVFALDSAKLSLVSTTYTVSGLNRYCKAADRSSAAIVAGDYYAIVRAMNQTTFDENLRLSNAAISSAAITVA